MGTPGVNVEQKDQAVLEWAGALGHVFVVVLGETERHAGLETMSLRAARDYATKAAGPRNPAIYRKTANGWKRTA